jgi:cobalt/nickel transport system ATP-binding protein
LLKTFKHTKVIATHDLDMAVDLCERTIVIYRGAVTADGPTLELLQDEALITRSGLEKPLKMQNCPACGKIKSNLKTRLQSTA